MLNRLVFDLLTVGFSILYFLALRSVWRWVPWTPVSDLMAMFVMMAALVPAGAVTAHLVLRRFMPSSDH